MNSINVRLSKAGLFLIIAMTTPVALLVGQQASTATDSDTVFAPYVSRLRVAFQDPKVQLTWQDPAAVAGTLQIYRSVQPITAATFDSAVLVGTADPGSESFMDVPPTPGDYYYAVLARKSGEGLYQVFIPFRNVTLEPVKVTRTATEQQLAASVSGIQVRQLDRSVLLTFDASKPKRTLGVYRSTSPILSSDVLAQSTRIQAVSSEKSSIVDYPVPGINYYYAVVDTGLLTSGDVKLIAGEDATAQPVSLPLGSNTIGIPTQPLPTRRGAPLPYLMLSRDVQSGATLAPSLATPTATHPLTAAAQKAVSELVDSITIPAVAPLKPVVLPEERGAGVKGDEYTLKSIVETPFADRMWDRTAALLTNFLTLPLAKDVAARAQFYLGQAYYFGGSYKQAFLAFLLARDQYYTDVEPWMDSVLLGNTH
ncbi:MAG TPA: hypothetical protein VMW87_14340 [Spirochaetia bacterium]|nr:hypothetical protein [Spirochaetia bacterium]